MAGILQFNFESEGYDVEVVGDGFRAMELFHQAYEPADDKHSPAFDAIVLDLMLPGMSGYEICRRIRAVDPLIPVLVLSARTLAEDRMLAFDAGTDQYLTKPFELAELLNRVRNLIERHRTKSALEATIPDHSPELPGKTHSRTNYAFPHFTLDLKRYELQVGDETHSLTNRELELLRYFIEHEGEVLSRSQILEDVWDEPSELTTRAIDNFVLRLRRYIEPDPANPRYILSVRGVGYRFVGQP